MIMANGKVYGAGFYTEDVPLVPEGMLPIDNNGIKDMPAEGFNAIIEYQLKQ